MNAKRFRGAVLTVAALSLVGEPGCIRDLTVPSFTSARLTLIASDTGTADGATLTPIRLRVDTGLPMSQRTVGMSTTFGSFAGGTQTITLTPDSSGSATAFLQAPHDSEIAYIRAILSAVAGATAVVSTVTYHRAQAESIDVIPVAFSVPAGITHSLGVTARLLRVVGTPSPGARVICTARDSNGVSRGLFTTPPPSDPSGMVPVSYSSGDALFQGTVTLQVALAVDTSVVGRTTIVITAP